MGAYTSSSNKVGQGMFAFQAHVEKHCNKTWLPFYYGKIVSRSCWFQLVLLRHGGVRLSCLSSCRLLSWQVAGAVTAGLDIERGQGSPVDWHGLWGHISFVPRGSEFSSSLMSGAAQGRSAFHYVVSRLNEVECLCSSDNYIVETPKSVLLEELSQFIQVIRDDMSQWHGRNLNRDSWWIWVEAVWHSNYNSNFIRIRMDSNTLYPHKLIFMQKSHGIHSYSAIEITNNLGFALTRFKEIKFCQ